MGIGNLVFIALLGAAVWWFARNAGRVKRNINLGRDEDRSDRSAERWATMARVALGQGKMGTRPVAAFLHLLIYIGFVLINIEVLEIIIDGIFGTHRVLAFLGGFYNFLIGSFEWLALGVLVSCFAFLTRRNILKLKRFWQREMTSWPRTDANLILITEILLMSALFTMNAADALLQQRGAEHYITAGAFPVSGMLMPLLSGLSDGALIGLERACWWFHIIGILAFLNYLPYSKHFHIILAFPNTYFSSLKPKTEVHNMERVMGEVKSMMDPSVPPPAPNP
ncbi:MAG: Fe-S oxidoreductase, partial [Flavobacteriales bacterium]|nr:Fe-S oxidoreductase [Flavobacteriales bacterium]